MNPQLVLPVCTVSPAGGGSCISQTIGTGNLPGLPNGALTDGAYTSYRYVATPRNGYRFAGFSVAVTSESAGGYVETIVSRFTGNWQGGVWTYEAEPDAQWLSSWDSAGYACWIRYEWQGFVEVWGVSAIEVAAVYEPVLYTHQLVNSSSLQNPVLLVHDPATDLLVADF